MRRTQPHGAAFEDTEMEESLKVEEKQSRVRERDVTMEARSEQSNVRKTPPAIMGFEDGQTDEAPEPLEAGKSKEMDPSLESPERNPALLDCSPVRPEMGVLIGLLT